MNYDFLFSYVVKKGVISNHRHHQTGWVCDCPSLEAAKRLLVNVALYKLADDVRFIRKVPNTSKEGMCWSNKRGRKLQRG